MCVQGGVAVSLHGSQRQLLRQDFDMVWKAPRAEPTELRAEQPGRAGISARSRQSTPTARNLPIGQREDGIGGRVMRVDGVFAAARGIRPYLVELLGPVDAAPADAELAQLLAEGGDWTEAAQRLREVLERRVETRMFLEAVLNDGPDFRPPQWQDGVLKGVGYGDLAGDHGPVGAPLYRCPAGNDYDWRQPSVGTPVPMCPTHQVALVRA